MNKPDDFDSWRMPDDGSREKVVVIKDTKVPSAAMFVIEREDHTLGHMMRTCAAPSRRHRCARAFACHPCGTASFPVLSACRQLLEDPNVLFGGYRVPHPLEPAIQIKVQTRIDGPNPAQASSGPSCCHPAVCSHNWPD